MNTSEFNLLFDVKCPVCGRVPEYEFEGLDEYGQFKTYKIALRCSHPEMDELIRRREIEFADRAEAERNEGLHTVHFYKRKNP